MSVITNNLLLGEDGYNISRSVRLRSSAGGYLNRTMGSPTSLQKMTWSCWVKRGALTAQAGYYNTLFGCPNGTLSSGFIIAFADYNSGTLRLYWNGVDLNTSQVFRDPSAWYHIVVAIDTTQATAANRVKFYVNGSQVTTFGTATYPTQNSNVPNFNNSGVVNYIGLTTNSTEYLDGYLTEINFIDGQQVAASSFGETDLITGVWKPKKYAGTYGTNGFFLNFSDNSNNTAATIGKDSSGNGNNWTPNNISVTSGVTYDSMLDVPTMWADGGNGRGNYATLNPLDFTTVGTISEANLRFTQSSSAARSGRSSIGVSSGKWYWEVINLGGNNSFGVQNATASLGTYCGGDANGWSYFIDGNKYNNNTATSYGASYTTNDVIGIALDMDAGTLTFYKNGTSQGTAFSSLSGTLFPAFSTSSVSSVTFVANFGQRPFAYTPPTGFKALNTQNLPDATIKKGNAYFDVALQTGSTSSRTVSGLGFQPNLVWMKNRAGSANRRWVLIDSVRGVNKTLCSNLVDAEVTSQSDLLTAFNSDGFTIGADAGLYGWNGYVESYVHFAWKESASAGFDIVTYTGNGSTQNIAHSLGVAPSMIITARRSSGGAYWGVYHAALGNTKALYMQATDAAATSANFWNNTSPTSSVFTVGSSAQGNTSAATYVAYLFAEVAGYSKFGSYTGNGSTDGPFVYCGFRPRYILVKCSSGVESWYTFDSARDTYNVTGNLLVPNQSLAESTFSSFDLLSNGFKVRTTNSLNNTNGATYIYAAFAENPFKNSLAR